MRNNELSNDVVVLIIISCLAVPAIGGILAFGWSTVTEWMVEQHVLIGASSHPLLTVPGANGAGLDHIRLMVVGGLVAAAAILAVTAARRRWQEWRSVQ